MSLLLDALRRAEEDSRKRKQETAAMDASASGPQPSAKPEAPQVELTLQGQAPLSSPTPSPADSLSASAQVGVDSFPSTEPSLHPPEFPGLQLAPDDTPQPSETASVSAQDPRIPIQSYGRYARPTGAEAVQIGGSVKGGWAATQAAREPVRQSAEAAVDRPNMARPSGTAIEKPPAERIDLAAPLPATTQRQALSAAGAMAGTRARPAANKHQRRQWVLAASALVVALPLVVFLLFGDALFGSSSTLAARAPVMTAQLPNNPAAPPAGESTPGSPVAGATETPAAPIGASSAPSATQETASVVSPVAVPPAASLPIAAGARERPRAMADAPVPARRAGTNRDAVSVTSGSQGVSLLPNTAKPVSLMDSAYAAYQAGKLGEATRLYQDVLRADPAQRDAWLGLAVIAHATNQREPAMDAYKRVLRLEPQNATALAGLSSLITSAGEPQQESRLREMLARSPQEADLNNALGLVLSGERRWSEAQPLFFKAHSAAPQEPQFAYNLAITLDHLRKTSLALQYYETALGLAQGRASGFDDATVRNRVAALKAGASAGAAR